MAPKADSDVFYAFFKRLQSTTDAYFSSFLTTRKSQYYRVQIYFKNEGVIIYKSYWLGYTEYT